MFHLILRVKELLVVSVLLFSDSIDTIKVVHVLDGTRTATRALHRTPSMTLIVITHMLGLEMTLVAISGEIFSIVAFENGCIAW